MKSLILTIFFINYLYAFDNTQWNKIIHFSNNQPNIISSNFYLSSAKPLTAKQELNATIALLQSKNNGYVTACNYPLRYTFLKSQNLNIPTYNLQHCKQLNKFFDEFKDNSVYLAYSSEYISVPSSAFGHIMVLLKNKNAPIEVAKIVHFAAVTDKKDGFFQYNYKGLTGGYKSYYILDSFFKKIYEYNTKEQRNIYLYKLDFSKQQLEAIIYNLFELRKATFKYYFFNKNCASYTSKLLNIAKKEPIKEKAIYLPIDTLQEFQSDIIGQKTFLSLVYKLDYLYKKLSQHEKKQFESIIQSNSTVDDNNLSNNLKVMLIDYYQFQFRKFHISYKNYNNIMKLHYQTIDINDTTINPLEKKPSLLKLEYQNSKNDTSVLLTYRPFYSSIYDFSDTNIQENEFKIFTPEIKLTKNNISLNKLTLLSIKSYAKQTIYYKPISWQISSTFDRHNTEEKIKFTNQLGAGISKNYFSNISSTTLFNIGIENFTPYIRPELYIAIYINKKIRLQENSYINLYYNKKSYFKHDISFSIQNKNFVYLINYTYDVNYYKIGAAIKYYF